MSGTGRAAFWSVAAAIGFLIPGATAWPQDEPTKAAAENRPISRAESLEFGKSLVEAFTRLDAQAIDRAIDYDAMLEAATEGVKVPPNLRNEFLKGAKEVQERGGPPLLAEFRPAIQAGADLRATKAIEWQGRPACLLRMILPERSVAYILFFLERAADGHIRAVDHYSLAAGESAASAVRRIYLAAVAQANRGIVDRLFGKEEALVKHIGDLERMVTANREGKAAEALKIYDALPEEVKREKIFQTMRFAASQNVGDDAKYLEAIQDFARRFPGDPACDFLLIDGHLLTNPPEPEKSLECIDRLEKALDGDAYLTVLRGNILMTMNRTDDALAAYRAAIDAEPDLRPAYDGLLSAAMVAKRFKDVAAMLDALESVFDEEIVDLSELEEFDEFLASPEGKAWTEKRETTKPGPSPEDDATKT